MKTIYISGPITDPATGQPREGWQRDFQEAEEKLRDMGFEVINPIDMAGEADGAWRMLMRGRNLVEIDEGNLHPVPTPRWFYLRVCIATLCQYLTFGNDAKKALQSIEETGTFERKPLAGIYVIGHPNDIQRSYDTMTEINFALSANLPVWSQFYHGYQINNLLRQLTIKPTLAEVQSSRESVKSV